MTAKGERPETLNEWALTWAVMICKDRIAELEAKVKWYAGVVKEYTAVLDRAEKAEAERDKYKWQRDWAVDIAEEYGGCDFSDLDRRWEERNK